MSMFRLLNKKTGLWYKALDEDANIIWTEYKDKSLVFPPDKYEFWEDDEDIEIIPLEVDEVMAQVGAPRLPGF